MRRSYIATCGNGLRISIAANTWGAYSIPGAFCDPAPPEGSTPKKFTHVEVFMLNDKCVGDVHDKYFHLELVKVGDHYEYEPVGPWGGYDGIYHYVPMHIVLKLIKENGGLTGGELPPH